MAGLNSPAGVASDPSGNIYIVDNKNNVVRKVDTTGDISTFAGTGVAGYTADTTASTDGSGNVAASSSELNSPGGVASDASGNIYIADTANNRIRMVDTSGNIYTIAGNGRPGNSGDNRPATLCKVKYPEGVAVDPWGNIYIADTGNNRVRKIDTNGIITTVAGTGSRGYNGDGILGRKAKLNSPVDVASDAAGNIYIADNGNSRVRMLTPSGIIYTVAGNGQTGYASDGVSAVSTSIDNPTGVALDSAGDLYISEGNGHRVRRVGADGLITTFAGNGNAGSSGDGGPATSAAIDYPAGIAFDRLGNLFVADSTSNKVLMVEGPSYTLPVSTILSPQTGVTINTGTYTISGKATAANGVAFVEVSTDGGGTWNTASGSSAFSYTWSPKTGGTHFVLSRSTDSLGKKEKMMSASEVNVNLAAKPPVCTITSPASGALLSGTSYTVKGTATDNSGTGLSSVEVSTDGGVTWQKASGTTSWSYNWSIPGPGDYVIKARATDNSGLVSDPGAGTGITVDAPVSALTVDTLNPSKTSATAGDSVVWTAGASGGTGSYNYQFMRSGPDTGGAYVVARDWSSSNSWTWTTTSSMVGSNAVMVNVKNSDGSGIVASNSYTAFTVQYPAIVINSLVANIASPANAGDTVVWKASASGGSGSYQYQFIRSGPDTGGSYVVMQDWSTSASWSWSTTTTMAGDSVVMVRVRNTDGSGQVSKSVTYTIVQVVASIVIGSLSPSMPSAIAGDSVVWTAAATGGTGSYQYQFERSGPDTGGSYVVTRSWGGTNSWSWTTSSSNVGSNTVRVDVRNADGSGQVSRVSSAYTVSQPPVTAGTAYYVDSVKGSDSNNGLSTSSPWKTLAKVNSASFKAGDRILLARGSVWYETLNLRSSGTLTSPIAIGAYGTGANPLIRGSVAVSGWSSYGSNIWVASFSGATDAVWENGTFLPSRQSSISGLTGYGTWWYDTATGRLYVYKNSTPTGVEAASRNGIAVRVSNLDISGLTIERCQPNGIDIWAQTGIAISNCEIHDTTFHSVQYNGASSGLVRGCRLYDPGVRMADASCIQIMNGSIVTADSNEIFCTRTFSGGFQDGIMVSGSVGNNVTLQNNNIHNMDNSGIVFWDANHSGLVRYNSIHDNLWHGVQFNGSGVDDVSGVYIYYNQIYRNGSTNPARGISIGNASGGHIYNNVLYDNAAGIRVVAGSVGWTIENNISTGSNGYELQVDSGAESGMTLNYNCWYKPSGSVVQYKGTSYSASTFGTFRTASGASRSISADPQFAGASSLDFSLGSSSPCKDTGVSVGLTRDMTGVTVPQGGTPDMGAFERI